MCCIWHTFNTNKARHQTQAFFYVRLCSTFCHAWKRSLTRCKFCLAMPWAKRSECGALAFNVCLVHHVIKRLCVVYGCAPRSAMRCPEGSHAPRSAMRCVEGKRSGCGAQAEPLPCELQKPERHKAQQQGKHMATKKQTVLNVFSVINSLEHCKNIQNTYIHNTS